MTGANTLTATVSHFEGSAKARICTNVHVKLGSLLVAHANLGGRFDEGQAIKEFKKNPKRFTANPEGFSAAKALQLV